MSQAHTFLMFEGQAKQALELYQSTFPSIEVEQKQESDAGFQWCQINLFGHIIILNDSPVSHDFKFTPSTSIFVVFDTEADLDAAFKSLSAGGKEMMPLGNYGFSQKFGWCEDQFGVSWQLNLP